MGHHAPEPGYNRPDVRRKQRVEPMEYEIQVENIKCGGCASSIRNKVLDAKLATEVDVDIETGAVHLRGDPARRPEAAALLAGMGYPETGSVAGVKAATARAKSFVSCAIGRIDNATTGKE
jgi:copper chaperone